ncbi:MAG: gliding motility-associated C-terminal domain-containing protein, partial [Saprospiraceae bacterium]
VWSSSEGTSSITVSDNTPRTVTVTDANGCTDTETKTLTVHPVPNAGNDQNANCYIADIITMNATGTGTWSLGSVPGSITISQPNSPNTTVSGFSVPGTYQLIWSNGNCEDIVLIIVGDNCDCPSGENNIVAPTIIEVCLQYVGSTIVGSEALPIGGTYKWEYERNGTGFLLANGINNERDYITGILNAGIHNFRRTYTIFANGKECNYVSNVVTITVYPEPTAMIQGLNAVCEGNSTTFTASGGSNYVWSSSEGTSSITVSDNTPRTVTVTDANGCTDTETKTLTIHSNPTADIAGDNAVCQGANATFTASGGTNYVWSSSEGTSSITVSDNTPRTVTVTDANGCTDTETKTLTINSSPTADIAGANAVCQGSNAIFTASGGTNYVWSSSEGTSSITVSDNTPRTVTITDANGCTDTETKTLTIHTNPIASISGDDSVCEGGLVAFTAMGGDNYIWSSGETMATINVSNAIVRVVTVTDSNGCKDTESKSIIVYPIPNAGSNQNANCYVADVVTMNATETGTWSFGSVPGSATIDQPNNPNTTISGFSVPGIYELIWSNGNCQSMVTITVGDNCDCPVGVHTITGPSITQACGIFASVNIVGNDADPSGGEYRWEYKLNSGGYTSATGANTNKDYVTSALMEGTHTFRRVYTVTVNGKECVYNSNTIQINVFPEPTATITGDDSVCEGGIVTFTASGGSDYFWSSGEITAGISVNDNTLRTVTVTDVNGCSDITSKILTLHNNPIAVINGNDSVCEGGDVIFTAIGGTDYLWSSGEMSAGISVNDNTPRTVTVTDVNGCSDVASKTLTIHTNPTATISGNNAICEGESVVFTASGGINYLWSSSETIATINVIDDISRTVTVTDSNGCTDTEMKILVVHPVPNAGSDMSINCFSSDIATMNANGSGTWTLGSVPGSVTITQPFNPNTTISGFGVAGVYELIWSNGNCDDIVIISVGDDCDCPSGTNAVTQPLVNQACGTYSSVSLLGDDATPAGGEYLWEYKLNNGIYSNATGVHNNKDYSTIALNEGTHIFRRVYTVTINGKECVYYSNIIQIVVFPEPIASISGDDSVCEGGNVTFTASGGIDYLWSSGETSAGIIVNDNMPRTVTVTDVNGCSDVTSKTLTIFTKPTAIINGSNSICEGENSTFTASGGIDYLWSSGETSAGIIVNDNTPRTVTVTDVNGCSDVTSKTLIIHSSPTVVISGDDSVCDGGSVTFTASGGTDYLWNSGETIASITVNDNSNRTVTVTDINGCIASATKSIMVHQNPIAVISGNDSVCEGSSVTFTASGGDQYIWSSGETLADISVSDEVVRSVTITDINGCSDEASKSLTLLSKPIAAISGNDYICTGGSALFTASGGDAYRWSSGENTNTIIVANATIRTVTVTSVNGCFSTAQKSLTIHPIPDAGTNKNVNCYTKDSVAMNAIGVGTWVFSSGPGTVTISNINDPKAFIGGFSAPGTYELIWTNGFCDKKVTLTVFNNCDCPDGENLVDGPVKTDACVLYPSTTLSGALTVVTGGNFQWFYEKNNGTATLVSTAENYTTGNLDLGNHKYLRLYTLNVNGENCVYNSNIIGIDVHPEPEAVIQGDNSICDGEQTTFEASGGALYEWSSGELTSSITVSDNTERFVTVTNVFGCQDVASKVLSINNKPSASISGLDEICAGESAQFIAAGGINYVWSSGENRADILVNDTVERTVTVTDINGCTAVESKTLGVNALPDAGNDRTVNCFSSGTVNLNAIGTGTWTFGSTPGSASIVSPNDPKSTLTGFTNPGIYELIWSNGACEDMALVVVDDNCDCPDGENIIIDPNINICRIQPSLILTGVDATPPGGDYRWEYANNSGTFLDAIGVNNVNEYVTPILNVGIHDFRRIYTVIIDNKECVYESNTISLRVNADPIAKILGDNTICFGYQTSFTAEGGDVFVWSSGEQVSTIIVNDAVERIVTVSDSNGCSATASKTLTVNNNPVASISGLDKVCAGENTSFTASGGIQYEWNSFETTDVIIVDDVAERVVTVTDVNGCTDTASKTLNVVDQPDAGPDQDINCYKRDVAQMDANGTGTWVLSPTTLGTASILDINDPKTIINQFSIPGIYEFIWTNGDCEDIVILTVFDNCDCPNGDNSVDAPGTIEFCNMYPSTILIGNDGSPVGGNYLWEYAFNNSGFGPGNGVNTNKDFITGDLNVGYHEFRRQYLVSINGINCTYISDIIALRVFPNPVAAILGDDAICEGNVATFTASGGDQYQWNIGGNQQTIQVNDSAQRIVTVTDVNGCTDTASKTLTIHSNPMGKIDGPDSTCEGGNVVFTASGGVSYNWSSGESNATILLNDNIRRIVTITDSNGCMATASKTLTIHTNPIASIQGNNSICAGESTSFTASGGVQYIWNSGETTSTINVADNSIRSVTVTDSNGCYDTSEKTLLVRDLPNAGNDVSVKCYLNGEISLSATGQGTWSVVSSNPGTVLIHNPASGNTKLSQFSGPGLYEFIWSDGFCEDRVLVTVDHLCPCEPLNTEIYPPSNTVFCDEVLEIVIAGNVPNPNNGAFLWEYSYNNGPFGSASGNYTGADYKAENLGLGDHAFRRLYLFENEGFMSCIDTSNIVILQVLNAFNKEFEVVLNPNPVCIGDTVYVYAQSLTPADYTFNLVENGATMQTFKDYAVIVPQREGLFTLVVSQHNAFCETSSDPVTYTFEVNTTPRVYLGRDTVVCDQDEGFELTIKDEGYVDISWNDGTKYNSIYVEESGVYSIQVEDENGCIGHDEIVIRDFCCKVYYPNIIKLSSANYINRQFQIKESGCVVSSELWIYDRWGNLIYKSEDGLAPWDGIFNGDFVQQGVYTFMFKYTALDEFKNEFSEKIAGDVTILR